MENIIKAWIKRVAGAATVISFMWWLLTEFDGGLETFGFLVMGSLVLGVGVLMLGELLYIVLSTALDMARERKNPFVQGIVFAGGALMILAILDLAILNGNFIVEPIATLIFTGNFGDSYWGCRDNWVIVEEGAFCDR